MVESILDVGSGPATYPIALCEKFSQLRATIVDLPGTLEITERFVRGANLSARIELIAGDYRIDPIPGSYDSIFLSNIIHGENYEPQRHADAQVGRQSKARRALDRERPYSRR